jgi:hypothetical protein
MAQAGKGRNQIAYEMSNEVSSGSVSNILKEWRRGNSKDQIVDPQPLQSSPQPSPPDADIITGIPLNINAVPPLLSGIGKDSFDTTVGPDIDFADIAYPESYPNSSIEPVEEQYKILQTQKEQLLMEIEEGRKMLDTLKDEMSRCGIKSTTDPARFLNIVNTFQRYGYDPSKIMNTFTEMVEIEDARNDTKRLKLEVENDRRILDEKLENLGLGDLHQLKQVIISIMTLESFGVGIDQIINLCRSFRLRGENQKLGSQNWTNNGNGRNYINKSIGSHVYKYPS